MTEAIACLIISAITILFLFLNAIVNYMKAQTWYNVLHMQYLSAINMNSFIELHGLDNIKEGKKIDTKTCIEFIMKYEKAARNSLQSIIPVAVFDGTYSILSILISSIRG